MSRILFFVVVFVGSLASTAAVSANTHTLKCNSNKDRVWVYDSLASLEVEAKLSCGETVEILERVQNYVKIRTGSGVEGYVPETAFSDLPTYDLHQPAAPTVAVVAKQVQAKEIARTLASQSTFLATDSQAQQSTTASVSVTPSARPANSSMMSNAPLAEMSALPAPTRLADETSKNNVTTPTSAITPTAVPAVMHRESEENVQPRLETASTDSACQHYFSAYGLSSVQLKWIALNRKKQFPGVCPAPDPASVNFVFIFTHDVNFFDSTLPQPVHTVGGFSDFQPLAMVDNALMSASDADNAHREYVWIFQLARGTFDPASFSAHRRYDFAKVETGSLGFKAGPKAVEDALHFAESVTH